MPVYLDTDYRLIYNDRKFIITQDLGIKIL